jgi:type IV secretion system protein VirB5
MNVRALAVALVIPFPALGGALCASAQGVPVIDAQSVIQQTLSAARALEQINQLAQQYEKQIEQLSVAVQQRDALLGARGLGELLNGPQEQAARRATPATLDELLRIAQTGQVPRTYDEIRRVLDRLQRDLELAKPQDIHANDPRSSTARVYQRTQDTTLGDLAVAEKAYDDVTHRVQDYERLIQEIDRTKDLKASSDLLARILAENGMATAELIRLQALLLSSISTRNASELANRGNLAEFGAFNLQTVNHARDSERADRELVGEE